MEETSPSARLKVMVVDDDRTTLDIVRALLEDLGHEVVTRSEAIGTAAQIQAEEPDFILLDIHMPALSGDRVADILSRGGRLKSAQIIFYSGRPPSELATLTAAHAAAGFIHKDGDHDKFLAEFAAIVAKVAAKGGV